MSLLDTVLAEIKSKFSKKNTKAKNKNKIMFFFFEDKSLIGKSFQKKKMKTFFTKKIWLPKKKKTIWNFFVKQKNFSVAKQNFELFLVAKKKIKKRCSSKKKKWKLKKEIKVWWLTREYTIYSNTLNGKNNKIRFKEWTNSMCDWNYLLMRIRFF